MSIKGNLVVKGKRLALLALLLMCIAPAFAEDTGWYAAVSAGSSNYASVIDDAVTVNNLCTDCTVTQDGKATGWAVSAGYQFNRYLSLEGQYFDLGNAKWSGRSPGPFGGQINATFKLTGLGVDAVGRYPFDDRLSVFGKLGLVDTRLQEAISEAGSLAALAFALNQSATDRTYDFGAGFELRLTQSWALRLGYTELHSVGDEGTTGSGKVNFSYLTALLRF